MAETLSQVMDSDLRAKSERALAYRNMTRMWAWQDLVANVLQRIKDQAIRDEDSVATTALHEAIGLIAECRGRRQTVDKILREIENIMNPDLTTSPHKGRS